MHPSPRGRGVPRTPSQSLGLRGVSENPTQQHGGFAECHGHEKQKQGSLRMGSRGLLGKQAQIDVTLAVLKKIFNFVLGPPSLAGSRGRVLSLLPGWARGVDRKTLANGFG